MPADPDYVEEKEAPIKALDETDIAFLKNYGLGPYAAPIKKVEEDIKSIQKKVNEVCGIKESDTGLAPPSRWDLVSDKQMMQEEQPLQVARCTKIINPNTDDAKYVINVKQIAKFVVGLGDKVAPTDIEEGMRVGVDRNKYQIQIPLPPKIDPSVTMMTVEEKPDITYRWVCCMHGGARGGSRACPGRQSTGCRFVTAAGHVAAKGAAAGPSNSSTKPAKCSCRCEYMQCSNPSCWVVLCHTSAAGLLAQWVYDGTVVSSRTPWRLGSVPAADPVCVSCMLPLLLWPLRLPPPAAVTLAAARSR